jgi:hypothetical protein
MEPGGEMDPTPGGPWIEEARQHWVELDGTMHGGTLFAELRCSGSAAAAATGTTANGGLIYRKTSVRFAVGDEFKNDEGQLVRVG